MTGKGSITNPAQCERGEEIHDLMCRKLDKIFGMTHPRRDADRIAAALEPGERVDTVAHGMRGGHSWFITVTPTSLLLTCDSPEQAVRLPWAAITAVEVKRWPFYAMTVTLQRLTDLIVRTDRGEVLKFTSVSPTLAGEITALVGPRIAS